MQVEHKNLKELLAPSLETEETIGSLLSIWANEIMPPRVLYVIIDSDSSI